MGGFPKQLLHRKQRLPASGIAVGTVGGSQTVPPVFRKIAFQVFSVFADAHRKIGLDADVPGKHTNQFLPNDGKMVSGIKQFSAAKALGDIRGNPPKFVTAIKKVACAGAFDMINTVCRLRKR